MGGSGWNDNRANTCPKTREIDQTGCDGKLKLGHGNSKTSFLYYGLFTCYPNVILTKIMMYYNSISWSCQVVAPIIQKYTWLLSQVLSFDDIISRAHRLSAAPLNGCSKSLNLPPLCSVSFNIEFDSSTTNIL